MDPLAFAPPLLLASAAEGAALPLAMLAVFGMAKLLGEACERLGQPAIVGEIVAGVLIGPSVLGWVRPNEILSALSELGVMFLLFRVGMEVKVSELFKVGGTALQVALLGVVAPFALGWGILRAAGEPTIQSIFVGAAMVATSVGITAQVLASKGWLSHEASQVILAAAIIDDILGLLVLALVSSMAEGTVDWVQIGTTALVAVGFTLFVASVVRRAANRVVPAMESKLSIAEAQFSLAVVLLFGLSLLAVYAGVAAIIGAFLAGMALSESVSRRVHDLTNGVTELLTPFFLAGIGLSLDVSVFRDGRVLALSLVVLAAAVFSKMVFCGLGAWRMGRPNMLRVGAGMVPRGEVGMVVAQLGLSLGVISQSTYGVVVFMAVATTLAAPPLLQIAYRDVVMDVPDERYRIG